jgi:hypothetical protein
MAVVETSEANKPSISRSTWHRRVAIKEITIEVHPPPTEESIVTTAVLEFGELLALDEMVLITLQPISISLSLRRMWIQC